LSLSRRVGLLAEYAPQGGVSLTEREDDLSPFRCELPGPGEACGPRSPPASLSCVRG